MAARSSSRAAGWNECFTLRPRRGLRRGLHPPGGGGRNRRGFRRVGGMRFRAMPPGRRDRRDSTSANGIGKGGPLLDGIVLDLVHHRCEGHGSSLSGCVIVGNYTGAEVGCQCRGPCGRGRARPPQSRTHPFHFPSAFHSQGRGRMPHSPRGRAQRVREIMENIDFFACFPLCSHLAGGPPAPRHSIRFPPAFPCPRSGFHGFQCQ